MADKKLHLVIVTPEKAEREVYADIVILPMIDGELGVQPGRSALVGQLGKGELRYTTSGTTEKLKIEGGFAQVRSDTVTVLTTKVHKN
jgi:F-type H+-transporting ATPase subunit epsilon